MGAIISEYNYVFFALAIFIFLGLYLIFFKVRFDILVIIHTCLLPIVVLEPSPADLLFILILFFSFKYKAIKLNVVFKKIKEQFIILSFFAIYIFIDLLSIFNSVDLYTAIRFFIITAYLILYSLFIYIYINENHYMHLAKAYIIGCTFSSLIGILGYFFWHSSFLLYDGDRIQSFFKDPNVFGPFLIPAIILLINGIVEQKVLTRKTIISSILVAINTLALILSFSRSAWAMLILGIGVYLILNIKKFNLVKIAGFIIATLIFLSVLWFVLPYDLKAFFLERAQFHVYDTNRFTVQQTGLSLTDHKIIGYGPGQFETVIGSQLDGTPYSAHSLYVRVLLENGIIGFLFLAIPIAYIFIKLLISNFKKRDYSKLTSPVLTSILCIILLNGFVVDTLHWRHLWLFIGLGLSCITGSDGIQNKLYIYISKKFRNYSKNIENFPEHTSGKGE